mgnify:CR=1 FL=1
MTRNTNGGYRPAEALVLALPAYLDVFAIGMGLAVVYLLAMARGEERPAGDGAAAFRRLSGVCEVGERPSARTAARAAATSAPAVG